MRYLKPLSPQVVAVSDDSWSCSNAAEDGWSTGDFVEGDNWKPAAYFNGHPPYKTAQQVTLKAKDKHLNFLKPPLIH